MNKDVLHDQIRHTYRFVVSQGLLVQIKTTEYCGKRMFWFWDENACRQHPECFQEYATC